MSINSRISILWNIHLPKILKGQELLLNITKLTLMIFTDTVMIKITQGNTICDPIFTKFNNW